MIIFFKELKINQKGLTIIELIISLFVVSIGIMGIFGSLSIIAILTSNIEDRLIATYLAQEGVEIIRNIRDTNWKRMMLGEEIEWNEEDIFRVCQLESGCMVDYTIDGRLSPILAWDERYLNIDNNNFYSYKEGVVSKFKRKITIKKLSPSLNLPQDVMKVRVEVFWDQKPNILNPLGTPGRIEVENTLYNWY